MEERGERGRRKGEEEERLGEVRRQQGGREGYLKTNSQVGRGKEAAGREGGVLKDQLTE